jgi:hypothetical protein
MKMLMRVGGVAARHDTVIANPAHSGDGGPLRAAGPDRPRPAATGRDRPELAQHLEGARTPPLALT